MRGKKYQSVVITEKSVLDRAPMPFKKKKLKTSWKGVTLSFIYFYKLFLKLLNLFDCVRS